MRDPANDPKRNQKLIGRVFDALQDGAWHTLDDLAAQLQAPKQRVTSRIRDLRLPLYGSYTIKAEIVDKAKQLWKYRLVKDAATQPVPSGQPKPTPQISVSSNELIKFFNTNTWQSELVEKTKCKVEPDGPYKRVVALDEHNNIIPYLVSTKTDL